MAAPCLGPSYNKKLVGQFRPFRPCRIHRGPVQRPHGSGVFAHRKRSVFSGETVGWNHGVHGVPVGMSSQAHLEKKKGKPDS